MEWILGLSRGEVGGQWERIKKRKFVWGLVWGEKSSDLVLKKKDVERKWQKHMSHIGLEPWIEIKVLLIDNSLEIESTNLSNYNWEEKSRKLLENPEAWSVKIRGISVHQKAS